MIKPFRGDFRLTQGFGENPASYAKFGLKGHNGLDYGLPTGTDVVAPHSGKVIEAAFDATGYGLYLKIENDKEGSVLAHLKENLVSVGTQVTEGQLIAHSDNTGNSTGPHLHWGYYLFPRNRQNGYAGFIDQINLISTPIPPTSDLQKQLDETRKQRDENWNLFQKQIEETNKQKDKYEKDIEGLEKRIDVIEEKLRKIKEIVA